MTTTDRSIALKVEGWAIRQYGKAEGDVDSQQQLVDGHPSVAAAVADATRQRPILVRADRAGGGAMADADKTALVELVHGGRAADARIARVDRGATR